jgi:hypothetical protein
MITEKQVYDLEADVRRLENELAAKKRGSTLEDDIKKMERILLLKRRELEDLRRKQRNDVESARREAEQKKISDRRAQSSWSNINN